MTLIPNPVYWQNLPSTAIKPEELDRVIRPIMDTLEDYLHNIRLESKTLKAKKRNISLAILKINITADLDKNELKNLDNKIRNKFFKTELHIFNGKSYKIEEQIDNRNEVMVEPILNQAVSKKVITGSYEAEISITPLKGIFIEFEFQSDKDKSYLKNAIRHYGKLIVRNEMGQTKGNSKKKYSNTYLNVIYFDFDENIAIIQPVKLPQSFKIRIEPNTSVIQKKIRAIQSFFERPKKYYFPILSLFEKFKFNSFEDKGLTIKKKIPKEEFKYLNDDRFPGVEEQREFVNIALNTPDFAILEGPPGSGKTTTILEILHQATKLNQRVIMVASTNVAVNNVLERIDEERDKGEEMHIFPIRLGDETVRGVAQKYLLNNISKKEIDRIIKALKMKGKNLNTIQRDLIATLENNQKSFDSFILDMANVVCGTTIGILRYPAFNSWEFQISEPFDMLIIDEASKTTLQEFLVPALLAKKWIIVGDKMQLSPYIEEGELKTLAKRCYIEKNFEMNHQWICSEYFSAKNLNLVITDVRSFKREIQEQIEFSKQEGIIFIDPYNKIEEENLEDQMIQIRYQFNKNDFLNQINQILGCMGGFIDYRCFFEPYTLEFFDTLPLDLNLVISPRIEQILNQNDLNIIQFICMKQRRKLKYFEQQNKFFYREEGKVKPWIDHLTWRLKRLYELRHQANSEETKGLYNKIDEETESLLPKWRLAEVFEIENLDRNSVYSIKNALRIKAHNFNSDNKWDQKRIIKLQFNILLKNNPDVSSFFNNYYTLLDSLNNEIDKKHLFEELIWFIIKKNSKEWLIEFTKRDPEFFKDLLTFQIGNIVYDTLRIEFPSIIELLQEGLMVEPKYRNTSIYRCTVYKGYQAKSVYWETREKRLTYQHRMHPDISKIIREHFYAGKQVLDPDGSNGTYDIAKERVFPFRSGPHNVWYDVKGEEIGARSPKNLKEVEKIYEWYCEFEKWAAKNPKPKIKEIEDGYWKMAIITFYLAQEYEISNKFRKHFGDKIHKFNFKDDKNHTKLKICTVDSFQGQEADIVLLSFVRSKKVGFLDSRNRLNVALSRAKYYQVLFGNRNFFKSRRAKRRSSELNYLANYLPHISSLR